MLETHKKAAVKHQVATPSERVVHGRKNLKLMEVNYRRNIKSDYTERMEALYKSFDYEENKDYYWGDPELSVLYGTPLYEAASESQKKALNHLFWAFHYYATAGTETNTIFYNQITSSAFFPYDDYEVVCHVLDKETSQERYHIRAFHTVGNATELALLGEIIFGCPRSTKPNEMEKAHEVHKGIGGRTAPRPLMQLYNYGFEKSPFLASQYYAARGIGNLHLKNKENSFSKNYKRLEKADQYIPAPTEIAHLHLLDEAFHTATSQLLSHEIYKDFPKPSAHETFMANMVIYMLQRNVLKGISGAIPGAFAGDSFIIPLVYRLLKSPLFGFSTQDALVMMEKIFCREHEGFHVGISLHKRLLEDICKFLEGLDYLWLVNREMLLMASVSSIDKTIRNNIKAFKRFSSSITR